MGVVRKTRFLWQRKFFLIFINSVNPQGYYKRRDKDKVGNAGTSKLKKLPCYDLIFFFCRKTRLFVERYDY